MTTRRNLITGSVAAIAAGALPIAAIVVSEPLLALEAELHRADEAHTAAYDVFSEMDFPGSGATAEQIAAAEARHMAAREAWHAAMQAIVDAPAISFAGLAVKVRLMGKELLEGDSDHRDDLVKSTIADVERLAGKGGAP